MSKTKLKGDYAEMQVACDLMRRGYKVLFPFGEDFAFDVAFIRDRSSVIERVQVKYSRENNGTIEIRCKAVNNSSKYVRSYSQEEVDWLAIYDGFSGRCYYLPITEIADKSKFYLKTIPGMNTGSAKWAKDYRNI